MNLYETILRANEEYTPKIQRLKDYILANDKQIRYEVDNVTVVFTLDDIEWDYNLKLRTCGAELEFSQFDPQDTIKITLRSLVKSNALVTQTNAVTPQDIIDAALPLVQKQEASYKPLKTQDQDTIDIEDMQQCVIKVKDIGNQMEYCGIIEDNTDFNDQYDMENFYMDRLEAEAEDDPTISFVLAYHEQGVPEFFDEFGEPLDLDMSEMKEFEKAYQNKCADNPTVPLDKDNIA